MFKNKYENNQCILELEIIFNCVYLICEIDLVFFSTLHVHSNKTLIKQNFMSIYVHQKPEGRMHQAKRMHQAQS